MKIVALYMLYSWILLIHCMFIGITAFSLFGERLVKLRPWIVIIYLIIPLLALEIYWIPVVNYLDLILLTDSRTILEHFNIAEGENLINYFGLGLIHIPIFSIAGFISYRIGKWSFMRNIQ